MKKIDKKILIFLLIIAIIMASIAIYYVSKAKEEVRLSPAISEINFPELIETNGIRAATLCYQFGRKYCENSFCPTYCDGRTWTHGICISRCNVQCNSAIGDLCLEYFL